MNQDDGGSVIVTGDIKLEHDFNYYVNIRYYGVRGNKTNETIQFQRALNKSQGGVCYIPKPDEEYLFGQILIPSNINISMDSGVTGLAIDTLNQTSSGFECLFRCIDSENVTIQGNGAVFSMNKAVYNSEHNHIFAFDSCDNITVYGVKANNSGGDGFYITGLKDATGITGQPRGSRNHSSNIKLVECMANNNRRNGVSIVGGYKINIDDCIFSGSSGTSIQSGADIEPEQRCDRSTEIYFNRCQFLNNQGRGFMMTLQRFTGNVDAEINVTLTSCVSKGNGTFGFSAQLNREGIKGSINYVMCTSMENTYSGFLEVSSHPDLTKNYYDCISIDDNVSGVTEPIYSLASGFYQRWSSTLDVDRIGGSNYYRCRAIDTRATPKLRRGFALDTLPARPDVLPENVYYEDCESVGHSISEFSIAEGCKNIRNNRFKSPKVLALVSNTGLNRNFIGYEVTNNGSTGTVQVTLPVSREGFSYKFRVEVANNFTIIPQSGAVIRGVMRSTSATVSSNVVGDYLEIKGREDGNWDVVNIKGTWSLIDTWTTAQRPVSPKTGKTGYNTTLGLQEYYNGTAWVQNISSVPDATVSIKGLVNQAIAQANISQTALEAISTADGSDAATTQALANAIKAYINDNVVPLVNAIRSSQNTELENQRTAGQQAP